MVENSEMTPELSELALQNETNMHEGMEVDEYSSTSNVTKVVHLFKKLDSKMCMATVLSYFMCWEQAEKFFRCLNRSG